MIRAAILIGVKKSGGLPLLPGVQKAVASMAEWLKSQGVADDRITIITDDTDPVEIKRIKKAVAAQIDRDDVEQLIIYFSGHGVNLRYSEYWLLSEAPVDTGEAVNLEGSVVLARQCGVPHVVFISDACRTAAEGLRAQYVTGGEIFPNDLGTDGTEAPVDIFFACTLGKPALEISDPNVSAKSYASVFTTAMVDALSGKAPDVLEQEMEDGVRVGLVRPRPLGTHLRNELPRRLDAALVKNYTQLPYARVTSDQSVWLSKVPLPDAATRRERGSRLVNRVRPPAPTLSTTVREMLSEPDALPADPEAPPAAPAFAGEDLLQKATALNLQTFGPTHFETECGFKLRGATMVGAVAAGFNVEIVDQERTILRAHPTDRSARQVLIELQGGSCVLLPAIPQFIGALTVDDGELVDVTYEPSEGSQQWWYYQANQTKMRALRSVIASSARLGVFRLDTSDAKGIATRIRYLKGFDPTMAVFAAYAFRDLRLHEQLHQMYEAMRMDMGIRLFDVTMLARKFNDDRPGPMGEQIPVGPFPLLSQGWSLVTALGVEMSSLRIALQRFLKPSLWSLFDAGASAILRQGLISGEIT